MVLQQEFEKVQNRTARFVTCNYNRDWNALSDSIITSVEGAEDSVARFTSPVRARDKLLRLSPEKILILKKCLSEALLMSNHISFVVK